MKKMIENVRIKSGQSYHKMLNYIASNPGESRSSYYKRGLGRKVEGMPGYYADNSMDCDASLLGLLNVEITGQYKLYITDKGREVLKKT